MGQFLSLAGNKSKTSECSDILQAKTYKRQRMSLGFNESPILIPGLPDEISLQILARLPRICYLNMKLVSRSWKSSITSPELYQFRKELGTTEEWLYILTKIEEDKHIWYALDPLSKEWQRLPPMPNVVNEEEPRWGLSGLWMSNVVSSSIKTADVILGLLGWKDLMPFCGCATGAIDGCLYVVGGFFRASAVRCVWQYDPCENAWSEVTSMSFGRAYCKTGVLKNKLYVVGGVSRGKDGLTPLQSAEMFDPRMGTWTTVPSMPFSRAWVLPKAFLADTLKPIATGMTSYRGRLCVPQSLYSWPFFVDVGGEIFDPETNLWVEMPTGMGEGWPARQAGTKLSVVKLSVVVDGELYALNPSSSLDSGKIKIYDSKDDAWKVIKGKVPIRDITGTESPYLLTGFLGKLHVITKYVNNELSVLQADLQNDVASLPSTSSSSPTASTLCENPDPLAEEEAYIWKIIATKNFGSAELVSCQVLDI